MWQVVCEFYSVSAKDTSCTIRLLAKFELPPRASSKTCLDKSSSAYSRGIGKNISISDIFYNYLDLTFSLIFWTFPLPARASDNIFDRGHVPTRFTLIFPTASQLALIG